MIGLTLLVAIVVVGTLTIIRVQRLNGALSPEPAMQGALLAEPEKVGDMTYIIPPKAIYDTKLTATDIPPISSPVYTSVIAMDAMLSDELFGIDIEVNGTHYYYPYQLLNWHRVVNTTIDDQHLAITYDPLTGAAIVYQSQLNSGEIKNLAFSGLVYNNGMLLADWREDLWWQMNGTLVAASHKGTMQQIVGETLSQYASQSMRWGDWKAVFPDGEVLSSKTGYDRDYARHPYGNYEGSPSVYFPLNATDDRIGGSKWAVDGLSLNGEHLALAKTLLQGVGAYNTTLGGAPITAFYDPDFHMTHVFDARVGDRVLTFRYDFEEQIFIDNETGSMWMPTGIATSGELQGTILAMIHAPEYYWFAWAAAYPDTRVAILDEQRAAEAQVTPSE